VVEIPPTRIKQLTLGVVSNGARHARLSLERKIFGTKPPLNRLDDRRDYNLGL